MASGADWFDAMMAPFDELGLPSDVGEDAVSLPSSVHSPAGSPVTLPHEGLAEEPCCRRSCLKAFCADAQCQEAHQLHQDRLSAVAPDARTNFHFELIRAAGGCDEGGRPSLMFAGQALCQQAYCKVAGCSMKVLKKCLAAGKAGHGAPVDKRTRPWKREEPMADHVDGFFMFCYVNLAEPLALAADQEQEGEGLEVPPPVSDSDFAEIPETVRHLPEWLALQEPRGDYLTLAAACRPGFVERRWLPHMSPQQFFDLYSEWAQREAQSSASFSTWRKVWKTHWAQLLPMRGQKQHSRCADCAVYSEMRQQAGGGGWTERHVCLLLLGCG